MQKAEWYVDWFNSPYYHLLYNHRDDEEAIFFIDQLCENLKLGPHAKIWDLACGKGRHSIALNKKGFDVTGTDLAENSIKDAEAFENTHLNFFVHDMRLPFKIDYFDAVFNLFTSIGYFVDIEDNYSVFKNVSLALKPSGVFVIDFFNSEKVKASIRPQYTEQRGEIAFQINKKITDNKIIKRIDFKDADKNYFFEETVSLLKKVDFEAFAKSAGLRLQAVYGDHHLAPFDENTSERLILIFKKIVP